MVSRSGVAGAINSGGNFEARYTRPAHPEPITARTKTIATNERLRARHLGDGLATLWDRLAIRPTRRKLGCCMAAIVVSYSRR